MNSKVISGRLQWENEQRVLHEDCSIDSGRDGSLLEPDQENNIKMELFERREPFPCCPSPNCVLPANVASNCNSSIEL